MWHVSKYRLLPVIILVPFCRLLAQSGELELISMYLPVPEVELSGSIPNDTLAGEAPFIVRKIIITGNKKTKPQIIIRELPFKTGDQYPLQHLVQKFEDARRQLLNTSLFHEVIVALKSFEGYNVDILIDVKERWYIFPIPYFRLVDRNFNEWIKEHNGSLKRVNYGIRVTHNNTTGRNDETNISLMNGYTRQVSFGYNRPYIDRNMNWGFSVGVAHGKTKEVNYNTVDNKLVALRDSTTFIRSYFRTNLELSYRRAIKTRHRFGFNYTIEKVNDTVLVLNPSYFKNGRNQVSFPEFYYHMQFQDVDYIPYPLRGYAAEVSLSKKGLNNIINEWQLSLKTMTSAELARRTFLNLVAVGSVKAPFRQPFFNQKFLGYNGMSMQGYEDYVIDGVAGGYFKATLIREIFDFSIRIPSKKFRILNNIPVRIMAKTYGNAGYVHNPQPGINPLTNKMLYSGGFGIDIVTIYDFVLKLEWSFNALGQNGLYLQRSNYF